ncbi:13812_t:CDS:2, partial [Dentiscutata heterogama]
IQASLPPELRNDPYQLRRFSPTAGDYLINMDPNSRIYDHFSINPDQNIIHIVVIILISNPPVMKKLLNLLLPNHLHFPDQPLNEDSLPYKIGSNITIKKYNKFLERRESSGYKYQRRDNGDVFIIDMSNREHGLVASLLQRYFNFPNNNVVVDPPIVVGIDEFHFSPSGNGQLIASDVTIFPNANHVQQPHIPYPGPPPGDRNGRPHARIICEVGNNQSTKEWNNKCQLWMNQIYIRYVLGIKLHKKRNRKNTLGQYHRSMTARLWQQGAG